MRIGEIAKATGVAVETLRFYEQEQLFTPPRRTRANYRLYGAEHLEQVRFIRRCRSLDISIDEIRRLLALRNDPGQSCRAVNDLLDRKLLQVDQRLSELQALQLDLQHLRARCHAPASAADCGILQGLGEAAQKRP